MNRTKKGMFGMAQWGGLLTIAIVLAVFGLILTVSADVKQDVQDTYVTNTASCGRNSTGGTGGTILYSACEQAYQVANQSLQADLKLGQKQTTLVTAGIGIFIITLLIGGFGISRMMR